MSKATEDIVIELFANSGHHYYFVPLSEDKQKKHTALCAQCADDNVPWAKHQNRSWIRYRPGTKLINGVSQPGFWVAIETNLGTTTRGLIYEPRQQVEPRPIAEDYDELKTPYAYREPSGINDATATTHEFLEITSDDGVVSQLPLKPITFVAMEAYEPIQADLVIDFGNTRTVALILESGRVSTSIRELCRPLRFVPRANGYEPFTTSLSSDDPYAVVDSWIVLHETVFSTFGPPSPPPDFQPVVHLEIGEVMEGAWYWPKPARRVIAETKYIPQMFVELSPTLLGGGNVIGSARQILNNAEFAHDENFFLSSPKRYAWDKSPMGHGGEQFWHVQQNNWNPRKNDLYQPMLARLSGPILMFMDTDGRYWPIEEPPHKRAKDWPHAHANPTHPRSDALTWVALSILETAYRQIGSQRYRNLTARDRVPRRLRNVLITFPSGWTSEELSNYKQQWQKAINIFTLGHLPEGSVPPTLIAELDEAVASQLPIIYSEINRLKGGENWFELLGRGNGTDARARVMNIDIGGGTTDVSVVEYRDTMPDAQVNLEATVLFKNSSTIAGDMLVKYIIERVLLPEIGRFANDPALSPDQQQAMRTRFSWLFKNTPDEWRDSERAYRQKMSRIVRLVFIPVINHWLRELAKERLGTADSWMTPLGELRDADQQNLISEALVQQFNRLVGKYVESSITAALNWQAPLTCNPSELTACIKEVFDRLFQVMGKIAAAFDCDLVLVSGKPSELPDIQDLLLTHLPLLPQRIIFAKDFPVGDWYPMGAVDGKIHDAKTPTVVGAALAQAMRTNCFGPDWKLDTQHHYMLNKNYWGVISSGQSPAQFDKSVFMKAGADIGHREMFTGTRIGRKRYLSPYLAPDHIYVLRWKDRKRMDSARLEAHFRRDERNDASELLVLTAVSGKDDKGKPITLDDVELQLCTLDSADFWMDNPSFDISWTETRAGT